MKCRSYDEEVLTRFAEFEAYIGGLQERILAEAVSLWEKDAVLRTPWNLESLGGAVGETRGGGLSILVEDGDFFERAGVNVSSVYGKLSKAAAELLGVGPGEEYKACGLSLVLHPHSPLIPSIHMNIRLFILSNGRSWFGGGTDLTPYSPDEAACLHFHETLYKALPECYAAFKKQCDRYFTLPHRSEMRGVGGVFFDRLELEDDFPKARDWVTALGECFVSSWLPIARREAKTSYDEAEKTFQKYRHGRYVEFNLLYDKGTSFGLSTGGRPESILMSLPRHVLYTNTLADDVAEIARAMAPFYQERCWVKV